MLSAFSNGQYIIHSWLFVAWSLQFTRDALITISGARDKGRNFVYFTDVKNIPNTDLATIERLWNKFSGGKFGYSVQKVRQCGFLEIFSDKATSNADSDCS